MGIKCFKHEVNASQSQRFVRLIRDYGAEGYGLYWMIIEYLYQSEDYKVDVATIKTVIRANCDEKTILAVLQNYGLFIESSDGVSFYSAEIYREKERVGQALKRKSQGGTNAMKSRWARPKPYPENDGIDSTDKSELYLDDPEADYSEPSTQEVVIQRWNEIFEGTRQQFRGVSLDPVSFQRLTETLEAGYSVEELEEAFRIARNDSFTWLLKDVLKQDNVQRLLVKKEKEKEGKNEKQRSAFKSDDFVDHGASASIQSIDSIDWSEFEI